MGHYDQGPKTKRHRCEAACGLLGSAVVAALGARVLYRVRQVHNARQGLFEREQYLNVLKHLPEELRPVVTFAYITGWRLRSEVLTREWRHVDLQNGTVRIFRGEAKDKKAERTFHLTTELRALLEKQQAEHDRLKKRGHHVPWVFFRMVAKGRGGPLRPKQITIVHQGVQARVPEGGPVRDASPTTCAARRCVDSCASASLTAWP